MKLIKIGGNELDDPQFMTALARAVAALPSAILVHGGGRGTTDLMARLGMTPRFEQGLRVTDDATLEAAIMGLVGTASTQLVAALVAAGVAALGLSGVDAGLVQVECKDTALGWVGTPTRVDHVRLNALCTAGFVPCLAPIARGADGHLYNVNADEVAAAVAAAMGVEELVYLSNVEGLLVEGRVIARISPASIESLIANGTVHGGMIPKVRSAALALERGVQQVVITNLSGLSSKGAGTRIVKGDLS